MIPDWNLAAVLPPVRPGAPGHSPDRSPYIAALSQMVQRFATSPERIRILRGLLAYRTELEARGISSGFQWLDGSFMEHKESLLGEAPNDVDVVTFFPLPAAKNEAAFASEIADLFDPDTTKAKYLVDAYPYLLGGQTGAAEVKQIAYWYSMWSHRRNGLWKGFVQVGLSPEEDAVSDALLAQIEAEAAR